MVIDTTVSELKDKIDSLENAIKSILYKMVCDSIKELIARKSKVSIDEVGSLLNEWGLSLENRDAAKRIEKYIPPWTEEEHAIVPLKDVTYKNSSIVFPLDERRISLGARLLPFATSAVLEEIKEIFEGNLEILHDMTLSFRWDSESGQLKIVREYKLKSISTDDASLKIFKKIKELADALGPFKAKVVLPELFKGTKTKETKNKAQIPSTLLHKDSTYNSDCIDVLMDMADVCYITDRDFWFKVDNVLIWEEPKYSKATYIFKWPEEPLQVFIFRVRISTLKAIRKDPDSGYKDKAVHVEKISNWEKNLKSKI
jgi:hypothetical protein